MLPCAVREAAGAFRAGYEYDGGTWLSSCDTAATTCAGANGLLNRTLSGTL